MNNAGPEGCNSKMNEILHVFRSFFANLLSFSMYGRFGGIKFRVV